MRHESGVYNYMALHSVLQGLHFTLTQWLWYNVIMNIKEKHQQLKKEVLTVYGGGECQCVKCGFDKMDALSIDHIHGNGNRHRRTMRSPAVFYKWLKDRHYPDGFQTLCMNCQFIKRFENNEHGMSKEARIRLTEERKKNNITVMTDEYAKRPGVITAKFLRKHIDQMKTLRFSLKKLREDLYLDDKERGLLRVTVHRMTHLGKLNNLGSGYYEKIVDGVNK